MDIGKKIKQLRTQHQLTLEELASRCELSKGFLSQVERDLTSPSVDTLNDILEALGTNMGDFFGRSKEEKLVFHKEDYFLDHKQDYDIAWIVPNAQKNEMEPIKITFHERHAKYEVSAHNGEEFGYVLKGKICLCYNEKRYVLSKGETFYLEGKYNHYIENLSLDKAEILWVSTPPIF